MGGFIGKQWVAFWVNLHKNILNHLCYYIPGYIMEQIKFLSEKCKDGENQPIKKENRTIFGWSK